MADAANPPPALTHVPHMLSPDDLYCNPLSFVDSARADNLRRKISYLFRNFTSFTKEMDVARRELRSVFFEALLCKHLEHDVKKIVGFLPAFSAFDIREVDRDPLSPDDVRIALIIGKPVAKQDDDGAWSMALEKRYVVALRVLNGRTVHMTKIIPAFKRTQHTKVTKGSLISTSVLAEGEATKVTDSCCTQVADAGRKAAQVLVALTEEEVKRMVAETCDAVDKLVMCMTTSLGVAPVSNAFVSQVKRMHSAPSDDAPLFSVPLAPSRVNTEVVDQVVAGMKRGATRDSSLVATPPKITRG